jgi:cell division protein FtsB
VKRKKRIRNRKGAMGRAEAALVAAMLAVAVACAVFYLRSRSELESARAHKEAAAARLERLSIEVERLQEELKRLQSDRGLIEALARQKLGFIRPGEVVIKLEREPDLMRATSLTSKRDGNYYDNSKLTRGGAAW